VASRIEAAALRGLTRFVGREKEMATLRRPSIRPSPDQARWSVSWVRLV